MVDDSIYIINMVCYVLTAFRKIIYGIQLELK